MQQWQSNINIKFSIPIYLTRSKRIPITFLKKLDIRKFFFTNRVCNTWNRLPCDVKQAPSVNSFKNRYDDFVNETYLADE